MEAEVYDEAVKIATECVEFCSKSFGPTDWRLADTKAKLGFALAQTGDSTQAEALLTETYPIVAASQSVPEATKRLTYERLRRGLTKVGRADRLADFEPPATPMESK